MLLYLHGFMVVVTSTLKPLCGCCGAISYCTGSIKQLYRQGSLLPGGWPADNGSSNGGSTETSLIGCNLFFLAGSITGDAGVLHSPVATS